jgi:hypothetical protein
VDCGDLFEKSYPHPESFPPFVSGDVLFVHGRFAELKLGNLACVSGIAKLNGFWILHGAITTLTPSIINTIQMKGCRSAWWLAITMASFSRKLTNGIILSYSLMTAVS